MISLSGIIRFKITDELNHEKLYRKFHVDYSDFMRRPKRPNVFNPELKEELNDLQDGSDMFVSDMDLNGDDDKK